MKKILLSCFVAAGIAVSAQVDVTATDGTASATYTNVKGAFDKINDGTHKGDIVLTITANTTETLQAALNANGSGAASYTSVLVKPSVVATISGSISANAIINLNGATNVTIDGSITNGGTTKDLTISNASTNATASAVRFINGASNNTVKNAIIKGSANGASSGVIWFSTSTAAAGNNNNVLTNNDITLQGTNKPQNAIFNLGTAAKHNTNNLVKGNRIFDFLNIGVKDSGNSDGFTIANNDIFATSDSNGSICGIWPNGSTIKASKYTANKIHDLSTSNATAGAVGINGYTVATPSTLEISNNMIWNLFNTNANPGTNNAVVGIYDQLDPNSDMYIYYNTVVISGASAGTMESYAYRGAFQNNSFVKNNIFVNTRSGSGTGNNVAYSNERTVGTLISDNNVIYAFGNAKNYTAKEGSNLYANFADWRAVIGTRDEHSKSTEPGFISASNLHLNPNDLKNVPINNAGTPISGVVTVTVDIDGDTRHATTPDIGADEFNGPVIYTVGATGNFPSLTNAGGVFEAMNLSGVTGNTTIEIIDDLTAETGTHPLNAFTGGYPVTIKPSGAARAISGTMASNALIRTVGASNITIDGSLSGGTDRSLSITNLSTTAPQVVRFGSVGTTPMTNNTLKNTIITNGLNTSTAVVIHDDALATTAGYFNNITIQNNEIKKAYMGIYTASAVGAGNGGITIKENSMTASGADAVTLAGIYVQGTDGAVIQNNAISNITSTGAYARRGIWLATGTVNSTVSGNTISNITSGSSAGSAAVGIFVSSTNNGVVLNTNNIIDNNSISNISCAGTTVTAGIQIFGAVATPTSGISLTRNKITNIKNTNSGGYAAIGIYLNGYSTAANGGVNIINNMIADVANYGFNGTTYLDNGVGITFNGASTGYKIYNNSINMNTNQTVATGMTAAINVTSSITAAGAIDLRNNIFVNSQTTTANRYAIYSSAPATVFSNIDYNDYYSTGANLGYLGSARATLAAWQTATGKDANSLNILPVFVSPTDLHLTTTGNEALDNKGTPLPEVTIDIDGDVRNATTPDMGADEFTSTLAVSDNAKVAINVYPNPVVDFVNINNSSRIDSVEVYSVSGQKVAAKTVNANSGQIDMSKMPTGMYIISVKSGEKVHQVKVIKK
ncbi:S-layer family protein [Chryseobacterium koreense]|uniref:beta strand repeat-containing protein n=1 Tax=Chryseobacterium koreense TaxID=232216 RepID=UPI0026EAD9C3|nr:T9SS type A sorting domain-containing protein [Chryseobacterium koreense]